MGRRRCLPGRFRRTTDDWPAEISWKLENTATNTEIDTSPTYTSDQRQQTFEYSFDCLDPSCYKFTILDGYGDGLIASQGGSYSFKVNGEEIATSSDSCCGPAQCFGDASYAI